MVSQLFFFPRPSGITPFNIGCPEFSNLPPFVKHEDPIGHDDWLNILVPVSIIKFWCILFDLPWRRSTRIFISLSVQNNVVEHWHEDDLITEVFNCDVLSLRPTQLLLGKSSTRSQSALHFILAVLWRYDTSSKLTFDQSTFFYCIFWTVSESEQTYTLAFVHFIACSLSNTGFPMVSSQHLREIHS